MGSAEVLACDDLGIPFFELAVTLDIEIMHYHGSKPIDPNGKPCRGQDYPINQNVIAKPT